MKVKILDDDEVVKVRMNLAPYSIRLRCCDCGLTHDVRIFKHDRLAKNTIEMIFSRNERCTANERKGCIEGKSAPHFPSR